MFSSSLSVFHFNFSFLLLLAYVLGVSAQFTDDFAPGTSSKESSFFYYGSGGMQAEFTWLTGQQSSIEESTSILKLTMDTADSPGAWQGPNMTSNTLCHFGTYAARIKIPDVTRQPDIGAVVGFYTYYNDEWNTELPADINENGLYDNSEIDFEWLIADPKVIYLTAYTDYHSPSGETKKVSRIINLATGTIYKTAYAELLGTDKESLTGLENIPSVLPAIPSFDASARFYVYGFDWLPESIRWWIINPENEDTVVLWDYQGPQERITQKKASIMLNIWHTEDWPVITNSSSIQKPADNNFSAEFDWVSFSPYDSSSAVEHISLSSPAAGDFLVFNQGSKKVLRLQQRGTYTVESRTLQGALIKKTIFTGYEYILNKQASPIVLTVKNQRGFSVTRIVQ